MCAKAEPLVYLIKIIKGQVTLRVSAVVYSVLKAKPLMYLTKIIQSSGML